ncbi:VOC family protein [Actinomadura sp. NAK00032]|uniref:VOC family protein n=1 Tax=Actinomadura sp. NAK00032 TaxID=2742128 RepID=UPI0020C7D029|nr:VOC family protein [Actinomadura sp. NAK00032]
MTRKNTEFELRRVDRLALVWSDMERTVDFSEGVLGMPLIKTLSAAGSDRTV